MRSALRQYREAKTATDSVLIERSELLTPEPDGSFAYSKALRAENVALGEYVRVLKTFKNFVLCGERPPDDPR